jgi:hypothetical protein
VCHARGWDRLRPEDFGILWEHLVLDTLLAAPVPEVKFWRDKSKREVDFVIPRSRDSVDAIVCKWSPEAFDPGNLAAFRANYPSGRNFVCCPNLTKSYERSFGNLSVAFVGAGPLRGLVQIDR